MPGGSRLAVSRCAQHSPLHGHGGGPHQTRLTTFRRTSSPEPQAQTWPRQIDMVAGLWSAARTDLGRPFGHQACRQAVGLERASVRRSVHSPMQQQQQQQEAMEGGLVLQAPLWAYKRRTACLELRLWMPFQGIGDKGRSMGRRSCEPTAPRLLPASVPPWQSLLRSSGPGSVTGNQSGSAVPVCRQAAWCAHLPCHTHQPWGGREAGAPALWALTLACRAALGSIFLVASVATLCCATGGQG